MQLSKRTRHLNNQKNIEMANGHTRRCSPSLAIEKIQIESTTSHLSEWLSSTGRITTSVGENVGTKEPSCTVGGKLLQPLWKTIWWFLRKPRMELPYDPAILLWGIFPPKNLENIDTP